MTNRANETNRVFHSMEQLKVELFPNMPVEIDEDAPQKGEVDEAESLAEKLINELMRKPKDED
ncbi:hypothetical protein [Leucothrix pacifica]|uniref:Uncharacterized protein n=1 Tax=Leucothrix pacifica TaxID=1247513 RepID=A0A317CDK3_9GAMM|nr:hypothetical protein [Leucothrix pacifica]PWQ96459.1 hypothetical protein DKW60_12940 [Leucothrix pacifica]